MLCDNSLFHVTYGQAFNHHIELILELLVLFVELFLGG